MRGAAAAHVRLSAGDGRAQSTGSGAATLADSSPSVAEFLGSSTSYTARLAPFWYDFHCGRNTATHPNSGLHVLTDTSGGPGNYVCYVTWLNVGLYDSVAGTGIGGHGVCDLQCVIREFDGVVEFRYGRLPGYASNFTSDTTAIVGFTRGNLGAPSVDPQSRDLSVETPFTTFVEAPFAHMGLTAATTPVVGGTAYGGRLFAGQTATWNVSNIPAGALLGVQLLDFQDTRPGLMLPTITAVNCRLSLSTSALLHEVVLIPPGTWLGTVPLLVPPGVEGFELMAQFVVLDGLFGAPDLITVASDALKHVVGRQ